MLTRKEKQAVYRILEVSSEPDRSKAVRCAILAVKLMGAIREKVRKFGRVRPRKITRKNVLEWRNHMAEDGLELTPKEMRDIMKVTNYAIRMEMEE